jgi:hypothetical protein
MKAFKIFYVAIALFGMTVMLLSFTENDTVESENSMILGEITIDNETPPCIQMYYYIEKYAEMYDIPKQYAYGIARQETGYKGAFQWKYEPALTSSAGAVGPMQIMMGTAKGMWPELKFDKDKLKTDIEFNVHTSMKLLRYLFDRHKDWKLVFGAYNTGRPMVNQYARDVYNHKL